MVQIPPGIAINSAVEAQRNPPSAFRRIFSSLFVQSAPGRPLAGVIPAQAGFNPLDVTGDADSMVYHVNAGYAITLRDGEGGYIVGTPDPVDVPTAPAHSTLPRIDRIYIVQPDYEKAEVGEARIDVVNGTAAQNPTPPDLPAGALELGRKRVDAGASNTNLGVAISDKPGLVALNIRSISASQISDPLNLNVGRINGSKISVSLSAPSSPAVGDVWVDYN